jgi:hypothetical protein
MRIEKPVDEMKVSRPAGPCTNREIAGYLCFAGRGEGGGLLMPHMYPFDRAPAP